VRKELRLLACIFPVFLLAALTPVAHAAGQAKTAADWDELSREIIPRVLEANLDMSTVLRYIRGASCTIDVTLTPPGMLPCSGALSYSWEDANDDGMLAETEVDIETIEVSHMTMRLMMGEIHKTLRRLTTLNVQSFLLQYSARTGKVNGGYQMRLRSKREGEPPVHLTISGDLRITKVRMKSPDGIETVVTTEHIRAGDKWLVGESVLTTTTPEGMLTTTERWTNAYDWESGIPLLSKTTVVNNIASVAGHFQMRQEYRLHDWKVVRREAPLELVGAVPAKREETIEAAPTAEAPGAAEKSLRESEKGTESAPGEVESSPPK